MSHHPARVLHLTVSLIVFLVLDKCKEEDSGATCDADEYQNQNTCITAFWSGVGVTAGEDCIDHYEIYDIISILYIWL